MIELHDYITASRQKRLRYGTHDCVTFAGKWAEARTGKPIVPRYASLSEGREILGAQSLDDVLAVHFNEVPVLMALPGDVAVLASDGPLPALGIVCGHRVAAFVGREIGFVELTSAGRAFRVIA